MVQRAGGAGVIILLLVLLLMKQKQKQAQTATAGSSATAAKKAKTPKTKSLKGRSPRKGLSLSRGRRGKEAQAAEPVAESKGTQGRMVPRLPAATADPPAFGAPTAEFDATAEPALAEPVGVAADASGVISEPGWPNPGEVWSGPDRAAELASAAPTADAFGGDDPMAALTDVSHGGTPGWATDDLETFDPATGWDGEAGEAAPADEATPASWEKEQAEFDWTAADSWGEPAEDGAEELASAEAAWEAPEEESPSWSAPADEAWQEPKVEVEEPALATAVTVEPEFAINDWAAPATPAEPETEPVAEVEPEPVAEVEPEQVAEVEHAEAPAMVWTPVDHVDDVVQDDPVTEVEEIAADPVSDVQAVFEIPVVEPIVPVAVEPVAEAVQPAPVEEPAPVAVEPITILPVQEPAPVAVAEEVPVEAALPVEEAEDAPEVREVWAPLQVAIEPAVLEPAAAAVSNTAARWASMAPGTVVETGVSDPTSSWARLEPGSVSNGSSAPAQAAPPLPSPVKAPAVAPAPSAAPSVAWWDVPSSVESDPRRGRFALGGYALQPGHQVVSGVTFRDGVVPPPSHWVIGPVTGAVAPGTLVLEVDGCLNCRPEDLAVLTDPGFAPTTDGFSLRLAAYETGPFAMSGTYVIS